ncbi:hypothetical protein GC722_09550 [Auraticoccus sp. F435]|uniref:Uncharacterized protein n=1 Tax=Auraticoccus cholistanensis TaxID=2656650 RepID=A0A6A9UUB8_9ACTN|nr:hypothetical protein [Auraticoccus cholistanensis]MVA76268.1 hypothetical protein [Auraticoccus cholistanensis]
MTGRRRRAGLLAMLQTRARPVTTARQPAQACPHCTNVDTLTLHCRDDRCRWTCCSCGALIYSGRRHRHPLHRSGRDTCHHPSGAV